MKDEDEDNEVEDNEDEDNEVEDNEVEDNEVEDNEVEDNEVEPTHGARRYTAAKYWLYVVFDCATSRPRLYVVRDPFGKLLMRSRTSVVVAPDEILRHSELAEGGIMGEPSTPKPTKGTAPLTDAEKLLALLAGWRAHPGNDEEAVLAELERALDEEPLHFGELDLSDLEQDE